MYGNRFSTLHTSQHLFDKSVHYQLNIMFLFVHKNSSPFELTSKTVTPYHFLPAYRHFLHLKIYYTQK